MMVKKKQNNKNGFSFGGEIIKSLVSNAQKTREGVEKYLYNIDPKKLMDYLVKNYDLDVHAKISFKTKPKVKIKKSK